MNIGIIGGGLTGLTAALRLAQKGESVTVFESSDSWGGLASAYEIIPGVLIERFYHHIFTNDRDILSLCAELKISGKLKVLDGKTSHLYQGKIYPLDTPLTVLKFSPLSFFDRIRFGLVTLYLKLKTSPGYFDRVTAVAWLEKWYGKRAYGIVWQPLLRGKFAADYDKISMTWFWARVKKRTSKLIYPDGSFQVLITALTEEILRLRGSLRLGVNLESVMPEGNGWKVTVGGFPLYFDKLITTTSLPTFLRMFPALPVLYRSQLASIKYLTAQVMVLVLKNRLSANYWMNVGETDFPFLVVGEQSNLFGTEYYKGRSVVYLGNYLMDTEARLKMDEKELLALYEPYLKKINPRFETDWVEKVANFVGPFAQPVVDLAYRDKIPPLPVPGYSNLFLATMAQVYPWDRGTNYSVKLANELVAQFF
ncbi:MAG: FAD-dependent oxidoreductase [Patescibacteria group bacterium]|mgnify:CR=1 FL=1